MDLRDMGFDNTVLDPLHELLDLSDLGDSKSPHAPSRAFLLDKKAMAATPADVKEYPSSYVFVLDMPGLKAEQIKVQAEDGNMLVVSGERKREKEKDQKEGPGRGAAEVHKDGEEAGEVPEEVRAAGKRGHGEDNGEVPGRGADGDGGEEAAAGAQEAQERRGPDRQNRSNEQDKGFFFVKVFVVWEH